MAKKGTPRRKVDLAAILSIIIGIVILIWPDILGIAVGIYLIIIGLLTLFNP